MKFRFRLENVPWRQWALCLLLTFWYALISVALLRAKLP